MAREIIIGDDESDEAEDALLLGGVLCRTLSAKPVVVSVVEFPQTFARAVDLEEFLDTVPDSTRKRAESRLEGLDPELRSAVSESPAKVLFEQAEADDAIAVVVGSTDRGPLGRVFPGSVAESLLQGAPSAVAIAPRGYRDRSSHGLERIAVALDGSEEAQVALDSAIRLAAASGARVTVLSVAEPVPPLAVPTAPSGVEAYQRYQKETKQGLLDEAVQSAGDGISIEARLLEGYPAILLAEASEEFDLMFAGSRGYGPVRRALLGSVSAPLTRSAQCPLLILPRGAGDDPLRIGEADAKTSGALSS